MTCPVVDALASRLGVPAPAAKVSCALAVRRAWMTVDWRVREMTPTLLDAAGLGDIAGGLRALPEIVDMAALEKAGDLLTSASAAATAVIDAATADLPLDEPYLPPGTSAMQYVEAIKHAPRPRVVGDACIAALLADAGDDASLAAIFGPGSTAPTAEPGGWAVEKLRADAYALVAEVPRVAARATGWHVARPAIEGELRTPIPGPPVEVVLTALREAMAPTVEALRESATGLLEHLTATCDAMAKPARRDR